MMSKKEYEKRLEVSQSAYVDISVFLPEQPKALAICVHGLGGSQNSPYMKIQKTACVNQNVGVIQFDCRNSFGTSSGSFSEATATQFIEDLTSVMRWVQNQEWYIPKLFFFGHSLGGLAILEYAHTNPSDIIGIAPLATVVSGELSLQTSNYNDEKVSQWKKSGELQWGENHVLYWAHMEDRLKYNVLSYVDSFTQPILCIVGDQDKNTPVEHQQVLQQHIQSDCELHIIPQMAHSPESQHVKEIQTIIESWVGKICMRLEND
ncbi:MAG: alpha/beta hydrolase family protein [Candidatus Woesearchaeota archaeon]